MQTAAGERARPDYGVDGYPFLVGLLAASAAAGGAALWDASRGSAAAAILGALALLTALPGVLGARYVL